MLLPQSYHRQSNNPFFKSSLILLIMRDSYVNNVEQILAANESQRNKIEFLERERLKRDHYLSDLQENLTLNKETLKQYNLMGSNEKAIIKLISEADLLTHKMKGYYEEYQNINALLLMEKQMRLEDKQFYQERVIEFENKLVDLRKYLHDKEESFTSVITRLKRYEEISQLTTDEKLYVYKKEMGERSTNEFITDLIKQKNFYKCEYEKMKKDYIVFSDMKYSIINKYEEVDSILQKFEKQNGVKINMLVGNIYKKTEEQKKINKKIQPPKELIRLLKKEKLNNQLLQEALNVAIQRNEELITLKDILEKSVQRLEVKCRLLHSENTVFALKLADYDHHFCRKYAHHKKYYEQGEAKGLSFIINERLKQYGKNVLQYYESTAKLYQQYNQKLKQDVEKWGQFLCDSQKSKQSLTKQKVLMKSCSTPEMLVGVDLDFIGADKLIIEEF